MCVSTDVVQANVTSSYSCMYVSTDDCGASHKVCLLGRFLVVYSKPFIVFVILLIDLGFPSCLDFYNFTLCLLDSWLCWCPPVTVYNNLLSLKTQLRKTLLVPYPMLYHSLSIYSGASLLWTPLGPKYLVRCPYFRGRILCIYIKLWLSQASWLTRCPYFGEVL